MGTCCYHDRIESKSSSIHRTNTEEEILKVLIDNMPKVTIRPNTRTKGYKKLIKKKKKGSLHQKTEDLPFATNKKAHQHHLNMKNKVNILIGIIYVYREHINLMKKMRNSRI